MRFFRHSIRKKLVTLLLICTIVPIVSSIVFTFFYTKDMLREQAVEKNTRLIEEGRENLATYMDQIKNASFSIYYTESLDQTLTSGLDDYQSESRIYTMLKSITQYVPDIYQVHLSVLENGRSYVLNNDSYSRGNEPYEAGFPIPPYGIATEATHRSHHYGTNPTAPPKEELVFTLHRPIYRVPSTEQQLGLLSIDVKLSALKQLTSRLYQADKEELLIIDSLQNVIYASGNIPVGEPIQESWFSGIQTDIAETGYMDWEGEPFSGMIIYSTIHNDFLDWTLVKRIPYHVLYENARNTTFMITISAAFFLLIATVAILIVSLRLTRPFKQLLAHISKIQAGQLQEPISMKRSDEFGVIANRLQAMMNTINELVIREYQLNLANKTNELKMLQAQINPHFLNNSLQSIGHLALEHKAPKVYSLISSLGQLMHYNMNTEELLVPLRKEIDYIENYCALQQQRFEDKLELDFSIAESTMETIVPKMIVQPIVENFFEHGFMQRKDPVAQLKISTDVVGDYLEITVEDNGPGIPGDELLRLQHQLQNNREGGDRLGNSIGLLNVLSRLKLYYGPTAGIVLTNQPTGGFKVTLSIPMGIAIKGD